jgi:hypothetical protein
LISLSILLSVFSGIGVFSYSIGVMCQLAESINGAENTAEFHALIDAMNRYMSDAHLPLSIRTKVRRCK